MIPAFKNGSAYSRIEFQPLSDPQAVVQAQNVRFTVLTSRLIRLEYSPANIFEDRPSQTFWYRRQPVPEFIVKRSADRIAIKTQHLELRYQPRETGFHADTLSIRVKATHATWRFGDADPDGNLRGTTRSLDGSDGPVRLDPGLMSRRGWSVVDDSHSLVFNSRGWLESRRDPKKRIDVYFFGYGHDYQNCLLDFYKISGQVPLIPRWALGNWWSRYWAYTQEELIGLMEEFKQHDLPISVCVVDMDWHVTKTGNFSSGWTGYTWNRRLFPEPGRFLHWLHAHGIKAALNVHPAGGVHPHEEQYTRFAASLGMNQNKKTPVSFDITDPGFAGAYFSLLHHPLEKQGVDFWWIDWQQGETSKLKGLDPLWWLNHLHFYDLGRDGKKRPLILSRWGGLGNHRYPLGFSGDTVVGWETLAFQPYFTSTAANVGYTWWSHDIGGHMHGTEDPELFTRWVQFGVFSPIFRLHSTNNPYHERRPWMYNAEVFRILRAAMQLRQSLIPYLYSMAHRVSALGDPLVKPMYYEYPEEDSAYRCPGQYAFGIELIVAPFVTPIDPDTGLSSQSVWLPPGRWFNFFDGECFHGGRWINVSGKLEDIPVFARTGGIIPLGTGSGWNGMDNPRELTIHLFPGADNRFMLYEDDGETTAWEHRQSCQTLFSLAWRENALRFDLAPVDGNTSLTPPKRTYHLVFHSIKQPDRIRVRINRSTTTIASTYDERTDVLFLDGIVLSPADELTVRLSSKGRTLARSQDRRIEKCRAMLKDFEMPADLKYKIDRSLPEMLKNKNILLSFGPFVKDAQRSALWNVIEPHP